jgi:leader peptidase (prepilin peptidase)/N-methyltransferase
MFFEIVSIIFGAIIGSFLNVCICRLPNDESIVSPGSHCPQCKNPIRVYDNIPLVSYALLGGKCRYCRLPISMQYPIVEGITALASLSLFMKFGPSFQYLYYFAFLCSLIVITVIDLYHQIIPDVISLPGIAVGLLGAFALPQKSFLQAFLGTLVGGGSLFVVATVYQWVLKREGMGGGDVKLLAMIGAFLGWKAVILTIVLSSFIGSVVGILLMVAKGKDFKYAIPFGPFLSLGAAIALFFGEEIVRWYLYLNR